MSDEEAKVDEEVVAETVGAGPGDEKLEKQLEKSARDAFAEKIAALKGGGDEEEGTDEEDEEGREDEGGAPDDAGEAAGKEVEDEEVLSGEEDSVDDGGDAPEDDEREAKPALSYKALMAAAKAGLTEEQVEKLGTDDAIFTVASAIAQAKGEEFDDVEDGGLELDGVPKEVVNRLKELEEATNDLSERLRQSEQEKQAQLFDRFDSAVNSLDGFSGLFGREQPKKGSKEFNNRERLFKSAIGIQQASGGTIENAVKKALRAEFYEEYQEQLKKSKDTKRRAQSKRAITKPGGGGQKRVPVNDYEAQRRAFRDALAARAASGK
jgi:hypothetical protein